MAPRTFDAPGLLRLPPFVGSPLDPELLGPELLDPALLDPALDADVSPAPDPDDAPAAGDAPAEPAGPAVDEPAVPAAGGPAAQDAGVAGVVGVVGVVEVRSSPRRVLRSSYLDTPDLRLTRDGVALWLAAGDGPPRWHLTLGGEERDVDGPADTVPEVLTDLLTPWLRDGTVALVASVRTERVVVALVGADGTALVELVDDGVAVLEGGRVALKHRELTLRPGTAGGRSSADALAAAAELLLAAGAVEGRPVPPLTQALGPRVHAEPDVPRPTDLTATSPASAVVAHSLRSGVRALQLADTAVRLDRPDGVHKLRVACRRLRSDLATFAPLVDAEWAGRLREGTRWLAGELGAARDLEVLRARLAASAQADTLVPLPPEHLQRLDALLADEAAAAGDRVLVALRSTQYRRLLLDLVSAAREPRTTPAAAGDAGGVLPPLVGAAWYALERRGSRLRSGDVDARWHEARIKAKRARYAAEAVVPALGKRAAATAKAAAAVQEVLGEHQDAATAAHVVLEMARRHDDDGGFCVTLGRLAERQRAAVVTARRAFPGIWSTTAVSKVARWTRSA